ncbi:MAG: alpha-ketoacid dehydrogenase subunit beta [Bacillati bacterium ANGP1]|uniref:Alpha-ketoacid dehydrogenase subunit beta n=1 Tax=Candidatus Segetimicrobium genomatis TaxID=2569760 RepID=A0A537J1Q8_9BACT|nr:MAG: alpha-ketoacid dehydrogenase subunit beta [Terrabacteria group bacterium ANGP1]
MRTLSYSQAIREAHAQLLSSDPRVFVVGQGVWSPWYAGTSLKDIDKQFGRARVLDSPVSENATTGAAIGAAIAGMRPIVFHPRMDFMLLAVDPIVNQAANWSYLFAGQVNVPVVIRSVINRGGEQGAQHSQAVHAFFAHVPGLKVVMPSTPYDAKGLLVAAVYDGNPVMYIDDRWLYGETGEVPEKLYSVPIGKAVVQREGKDVTVVAISWMAREALNAAGLLQTEGIDTEVIDLRSLKPLDDVMILESVKKTGRLVVADGGWKTCGIAAEIAALASTHAFEYLKAPILRVTLPDCPAPMSSALEDCYYPKASDVATAVKQVMGAAVGR